MITAGTITDEQIRELRDAASDGIVTAHVYYSAAFIRLLCEDALDVDGMRGDVIERKAKVCCAEILNARAKAQR